MSADRNLLFGILALQLNFVTRDQLVEGMNKWVLDKAKSLGEIFVTSGAMDSDQFKLLDALVDKHVEKHGGDVQKSIEQLSSIDPDATQQLKSIKDTELQATIGYVSNDRTDPYSTQLLRPVRNRSSERFRIIRPHARGGLGEVFVAKDTELSREVALKEIQGRFANNFDSRERFLREAQITGGLEHPGIVPVYGLGTYDDGQPFYAMKFIKGDSLKDAIDKFYALPETKAAKSLMIGAVTKQFRELLGRFVDVCNAVHYAHSKGVLHRDLKPGNIMLGEYGETLVVDWGLAKVLGERVVSSCNSSHAVPVIGNASTHTLQGTAIGTPAYMSPEQAMGNVSELGPATDIYSLGATLFQLLTGTFPRPFKSETSFIRETAKQVDPRVPLALNAICCKAMHALPQDRYTSAKELASEIEAYLADERVNALKESYFYRAGRWLRKRYKYLVIASSSAMVVIVVLIICVWLVDTSRKREEIALSQAEQSLVYAREAVDEYFTQVSEESLLNQPGLLPLRRDLLQRALRYYEQFTKDRSASSALNRDLAKAFYNMGRAQEELDQYEKSLGSYSSALSLHRVLQDEAKHDNNVADGEGDVLNALGRVNQKLARLEIALRWNSEALGVREALHIENPSDSEYARKYANSLMNEGIIWLKRGEVEKGEKRMSAAQEIRQRFAPTIASGKLFRDYAMGNYNLGAVAIQMSKTQAAQVYFEESAKSFASILDAFPNDNEYRKNLVSCYSMLADLAVSTELSEALEYNEKAIESQKILAFQNPESFEFKSALARLYLNTSQMYESRDSTLALEFIEKAIQIFSPAEETLTPDQRRDYAVSLIVRAAIKQIDADRRDVKTALSILSLLCSSYPDNADYREAFTRANEVASAISNAQ